MTYTSGYTNRFMVYLLEDTGGKTSNSTKKGWSIQTFMPR